MTAPVPIAPLGSAMWWNRRPARERLLLLALALAVAAYVLTIGVIRPLLVLHAKATASIIRSEAAMAQLASAPVLAEIRPVPGVDEPVAAIITSTADMFNLTIRRIETKGDVAQLAIEDAAFADVIRWLEVLERDYRLRLQALEMNRRPEPGFVSASITVLR